MEKIWPPIFKYCCKKCGDTLQSKWPGQFVSCTCQSVSVDQTEYYTRILGDPDNIEEIEDAQENKNGL